MVEPAWGCLGRRTARIPRYRCQPPGLIEDKAVPSRSVRVPPVGHYGMDNSLKVSLHADLADSFYWNAVVNSHELRARIIEFARWNSSYWIATD
jgi:hypothetical protein